MQGKSQKFNPRQHMQTETFEVFHYRDAVLEPVALHQHDFYEVYFFLSGQVEYRVEGCVYRLEPGNLLLINPMEFHQPVVEPGRSPYERIVLWINKKYLEGLSFGGDSLTVCFDSTQPAHSNLLRLSPAQQEDVSESLEKLVREARSDEYGAVQCAAGVLLQLMVALNRIARSFDKPDAEEGQAPLLVKSALAYIGEHYCEPLSLERLAEAFYVSKYHLAHVFQQAVGTSVYHYIILRRLVEAKQMLSSGIAPGIVCVQCGFGDYANFYRAFKAEYGISPQNYRNDGNGTGMAK